MKTIVSGIQPTGNLHIGNYLGAVKNWLELQKNNEYQLYIFIADLHSLTGKLSAEELNKQTKITIAELLALGINPDKVTFFKQSAIKEHTELAWFFSCVTPISELYRMTQFKDKSEAQTKNINSGLLTYPILQAADILLYKGDAVPVGEDQVQHIELTRDTARWFNKKYKTNFFPETKHLLTHIPKIKSLLEPGKKMSKSLGSGHVIELADEPEVIQKKLNKAVTASEGGNNSPGAKNLLTLLKEFGSIEKYNLFVKTEKDGDIRYGDLKTELTESIARYFAEFRKTRDKLLNNPEKLEKIMIHGAKKAKKIAQKNMEEIRKIIGLT